MVITQMSCLMEKVVILKVSIQLTWTWTWDEKNAFQIFQRVITNAHIGTHFNMAMDNIQRTVRSNFTITSFLHPNEIS